MREDLTFLREQWAPRNKSFSPDQEKAFQGVLDNAMARAEQLSPSEFALEVSRALAVGRNGHTAPTGGMGRFFRSLPVMGWWFSDGFYILRAHPQFAELLGTRIERIGRLTPDEALVRAQPFISGTDQRSRIIGASYLMRVELLRTIGATDGEDIELTVRLQNGSTRVIRLGATPAADPDGNPLFATIRSASGIAGRWSHVHDQLPMLPSAYQRPTDMAFDWIGEAQDIAYFRSNFIRNVDATPMQQKLQEAVVWQVAPRRPRFAIIDLRLNNGGDFFNTLLLTQALPRLMSEGGKIFVLVDRGTFSAALVTAALFKSNAPGRTILIGETMGDTGRFWAEGGYVRLPNSEIEAMYNDGLHDWINGCANEANCYWPVRVWSANTGRLEPDIRITPTFADYASGRDPVLERALSLAR
jgi:hypothetical protein